MESQLQVYNSLNRKKEVFTPLVEGYVGMYVCGPTVYSNVHLGNCRTFVNFDLIYRYLQHLGYRVRYVRNITDVGHLEGDADIGREDKISKQARLLQKEPMEIAQEYTLGFHKMMDIFNTLPPSIEPRATGHILEQIEMVQKIIDNGYGYEKNGSVYFNTRRFYEDHQNYGQLSGRKIDELLNETRDDLKNQGEKENPTDFAIWIKADPSHLMRWDSPWSVGFPGWHLECSAMSTKYLGETFDIHGGGNDLKFPHHENEVAQNYGACGCTPSRYWLHANMLLMNGKKMSKSDGNNITPGELFSGESNHISKGYSPMVIRFFMLQSHYRSTLDLTDDALLAAEKGYHRLMEANRTLEDMQHPGKGSAGELNKSILDLCDATYADMNDDFNAPKALARLFELVPKINGLRDGHLSFAELTPETIARLKEVFRSFIFDIFGLIDETKGGSNGSGALLDGLMDIIISLRKEARTNKDWTTADFIRNQLGELKVVLKDGKEGTSWTQEN